MSKNTVKVSSQAWVNIPFENPVSTDDLDLYIDDLRLSLRRAEGEFMKQYPTATDIKFNLYLESAEYEGDNDSIWFGIVAERPMTEAELAKQKEQEKRQLEFQRNQYEALKKKFEGK